MNVRFDVGYSRKAYRGRSGLRRRATRGVIAGFTRISDPACVLTEALPALEIIMNTRPIVTGAST